MQRGSVPPTQWNHGFVCLCNDHVTAVGDIMMGTSAALHSCIYY